MSISSDRYFKDYISRAGSKSSLWLFQQTDSKRNLSWVKNPSDIARLERYARYTAVFMGRQQAVTLDKITERLGSKSKYSFELYLAYNLAGLISRKFADLTCGVPPDIKGSKNQDVIKDIIKTSLFNKNLYKAATTVGYKGDIVMMPIIRNNKVAIKIIRPEEWFPTWDNNDEMIAATIAWHETFPDPEKEGAYVSYLRKEIHTPGLIINKMYRLVGGKLTQVPIEAIHPEVPLVQPTGVDELLVVHIPNYDVADSPYGISDYEDVFDMFEALSSRITTISRVLDMHSDPILTIPESFMEKDNKTGVWSVKSTGANIYPMEGDMKDPKYITWDGALDAAFRHVESLRDAILQITETSPALVGLQNVSGAESAAKRKLDLTNSLAKARRKRLYLGCGIEQVFELAFKLGNAWNIFRADPDEEVVLQWHDALPTDRREEAEIEQIRTGNKPTSSIESSIERLDGANMAEDELIRMKEEVLDINTDEGTHTNTTVDSVGVTKE